MSNIDTQPNPPPNSYDEQAEREKKNQAKRMTKDAADEAQNRAEEAKANARNV